MGHHHHSITRHLRLGMPGRPAIALTLLISILIGQTSSGGSNGARTQAYPSAPVLLDWKQLDGNQINCTIANDGPFADFRKTSSAGLEWPTGSGKTAIYTGGLWLNARHAATGSLRTANMDFNSEYQPGPLLEVFNTTTNDDTGPVARAGEERYRLYKISRDDTTSLDYVEWPGDLGAPYDDINDNGRWDAGIDRPKLLGDQQIWSVINDVNNSRHASLGATPPMGLEVHMLYYVFAQPHPLENTMFIEWELINKSDANYDSVYAGIWIDVDLGVSDDDLPGSDSSLALGYVYNGFDIDDPNRGGYGDRPPAVGCVILQGTDAAMAGNPGLSLGAIQDSRVCSASSYVIFSNSVYPELVFPFDGNPAYAPAARNAHEGRASQTGEFLKGVDSSRMLFWFDGDPVGGTGNLPSNFPLGPFRPQEVWVMLNGKPFALAQGDTQRVAVAIVISQGANRLASVTELKQDVAWVRDFYLAGGVVGVSDGGDALPKRVELQQNYPNPFNPSTTIELALPHAGFVTLKVHNVLGQDVATLIAGDYAAGTFKVTWDASPVPSGVYFYRLTAGEFVQTRKMVLTK